MERGVVYYVRAIIIVVVRFMAPRDRGVWWSCTSKLLKFVYACARPSDKWDGSHGVIMLY